MNQSTKTTGGVPLVKELVTANTLKNHDKHCRRCKKNNPCEFMKLRSEFLKHVEEANKIGQEMRECSDKTQKDQLHHIVDSVYAKSTPPELRKEFIETMLEWETKLDESTGISDAPPAKKKKTAPAKQEEQQPNNSQEKPKDLPLFMTFIEETKGSSTTTQA